VSVCVSVCVCVCVCDAQRTCCIDLACRQKLSAACSADE